MKKLFFIAISSIFIFGCKKQHCERDLCNIEKVYADNETKVTLANGFWGTVSMMEGNCMPMVPPTGSSCKHCAVKRTLKVYDYTTLSQATPAGNSTVFFLSLSTALITQVESDDAGFFQVNLPAGIYTVVVVEDGKLYAPLGDTNQGLNPVTVSAGAKRFDVVMTYKAVF